ncbi:MAG: GAF domain-containing protein, partial [Anaerolineae bacterium]|nr:GAF domain-containing protein [Anaerolineae bacterium]
VTSPDDQAKLAALIAPNAMPPVDLPIVAILTMPIWRKEQIEGLIMLAHDEPREWLPAEQQMLDAIGRQIGIALANARSFMDAVQGEARVRTILQSVAEGLLVFDEDNHLLLMNAASRAMLDFYPAELGGPTRAAALLWKWMRNREPDSNEHVEFRLPVAPLVHEDREALLAQCEMRRCQLAREETVVWPCWLRVGGPMPHQMRQCALYHEVQLQAIQARSAEVRDVQEQMLGTVIALHDVTYFRELDELKERFVSTVSHELRTPLSTILLQVSTLIRYYDRFDEAERRSMIGEMQEQSQVLRDLIEDILELSRFDAHKSVPSKQWFDLIAKCHEVLSALELAIEKKQLTLRLDGVSGSRYVMGDSNQIARVLRNLINNAIKYTPSGGTITLRVRQIGTEITFAVIDTGIGMTPEEVAHVFDRFYRAAQAVRMASGTGLGLSISKEIVEMHNGHIEAISTLGEGSTFTVTLPIGDLDLPGM